MVPLCLHRGHAPAVASRTLVVRGARRLGGEPNRSAGLDHSSNAALAGCSPAERRVLRRRHRHFDARLAIEHTLMFLCPAESVAVTFDKASISNLAAASQVAAPGNKSG